MNQLNDHDLLLKLAQKLDMFYEEFRRASNGVGFHRCGERQARIEQLEEDVKLAHKRIDDLKTKLWWAMTTALTSAGGLLIMLAKELLTK